MGLFTDGFKELKKASEPLYKSPKSIQETIEIMAVAENGIFEVARNRYSKCYLFQDINYTTTNEDEQIDIFERYCKFLNSLDCNYKITVNNKNKNMTELREKVMFPKKGDGFDEYRQAYNDIIEEKILDGRQGIEQERYLTLTIERKNFEEAKAQFATIEATVHKAFGELGADITALSGNERLKVLHDFYGIYSMISSGLQSRYSHSLPTKESLKLWSPRILVDSVGVITPSLIIWYMDISCSLRYRNKGLNEIIIFAPFICGIILILKGKEPSANYQK